MEHGRSGSIHDLGSAPEAPDALSFSLEGLTMSPSSPRTSPRGLRRSLSPPLFVGSGLSIPFDDDGNSCNFVSNRPRQNTAPGRMDVKLDGNEKDTMVDGSLRNLSMQTDYYEGDDEDDDYLDHEGLESSGRRNNRIRLCGIFPMPECFCSEGFNSRVASFLVRHAPCFWLCGNALEVGSTDRTILYRLNILCAILASGQILAGGFLTFVLLSDIVVDRDESAVVRDETSSGITLDLWNVNGSIFLIGLLGCVVLITSLMTLRVVREVNLRGAVRYLWTLLWVLPIQIFLVVTLFDIFRVTEVWVRHWWYLSSMAWFRRLTCEPGTSNTLCVVPISGGTEFANEQAWCVSNYNATNCTDIRSRAQDETLTSMLIFYYAAAFWGLFLTLLLMLTTNILQQIITRPIVQTSKESNVAAWMSVPIIGCFTTGSVFLFSPSSALRGSTEAISSQWVGLLYIFCGGFFFLSALLGWFIGTFSILNARDKRNKSIAVGFFMGINALSIIFLGAVFGGSVLVSTDTVAVSLTDTERGRAACDIDTAESCSYCGNRVGFQECPEWTTDEVLKVLQTQYRSSAALALIFIIYAISALRFGFLLRKHISMYQIDYV